MIDVEDATGDEEGANKKKQRANSMDKNHQVATKLTGSNTGQNTKW